MLPGVSKAIRALNRKGFLVIVVTNQSGIGRGMYGRHDVEALHKALNARLKTKGAHIDAFYYCPHHPTAAKEPYRVRCQCRKPGTALFRKAISEFAIDPRASFLIGDSLTDVQAGKRIGLTTIHLLGGKTGPAESLHPSQIADYQCRNLTQAAMIAVQSLRLVGGAPRRNLAVLTDKQSRL